MKTKIGIFDSGIGGTTVLKQCIKENPNFEYIYYSDSKNNPYGEKTPEEIIYISDDIVSKLIKKGCNIIIIACNTASAVASTYLREKYPNIHIIAIEPAIKQAYINTKDNEYCLIMATPQTVKSDKFKKLYNTYHKHNFYILPCEGLANLIELRDSKKIKEYLLTHLSQYKNKVTSVVLGCTHYSLIKEQIKETLGDITFYDGAEGVSHQLKKLIQNNNIEESNPKITWIDSSNQEEKINNLKKIMGGIYDKYY